MASSISTRLVSGRSLLTPSVAARYLRRNPQSIMILVAQQQHPRYITTETQPSSSNIPPPGFNVKEAQKPIPKEKAPTKPSQVQSIRADNSSAEKSAVKSLQTQSTTDASKEINAEAQALKSEAEKDKEKQLEKKKEEDKKLTIWEKVKKEANHYWDGTKLLGMEIKISVKLAIKMAAGYELSRRESRQLQRTVQDIGRLVPFSVFVIVPFAELLLPVAIKLFPNLLPSTYEGKKDRDRKSSALRANRKDVSDFLKTSIQETGLPFSTLTKNKEEFVEFFRKVRTSGESPSHEDVINVCKLFKDDLTLDNLSRPQLVGMCRYMNLSSFGTDMILRYTIRHRMRQIKRDDRAIWIEGVNSLSVPELQTACASRGMRTHGMSPARLRDDMQTWLELRLKHDIPSTLLVLSNAFMYAQGKENEIESHYDALEAVLSSIPEALYHEIELEVHSAEGAATNKQRLSVLKEQQKLIEEENTQGETDGTVSSKLDKDIDEKEKKQAATTEGSQKERAEAVKSDKDLEKAMESHEGEKNEDEAESSTKDAKDAKDSKQESKQKE